MTVQWVSVVNATHILQCARAHDCIEYHWLSVNEYLCWLCFGLFIMNFSVGYWPARGPAGCRELASMSESFSLNVAFVDFANMVGSAVLGSS